MKSYNVKIPFWALMVGFLLLANVADLRAENDRLGHSDNEWTIVNDSASWDARAGLQVVNHRGNFILMGGRTPLDPVVGGFPGASVIWSDVWRSKDKGADWTRLLESNDPAHWPARAYFQALSKSGYIYVMGGQNFQLIPNPDPNGPPFISQSVFYNDVWRSKKGVAWEQMTDSAKWSGRAGLSAISFRGEIYVMGGSFNDDPAVIGGPPIRVYFNDVYKSVDGSSWECLTDSAPWAPRAGAALAVKNGKLYLFGGEDGFTCLPGLRCPPYYNDVWSTEDGVNWELVTDEADWPSRPGHRVEVIYDHFVMFGGFGLSPDPNDPFKPSNPIDVWISKDGMQWNQLSGSPWNAISPEEVKYDFATVVDHGGRESQGPAIYTFGGDRETFNFADPTNYLNIDNDVWRFNILRNGNNRNTGTRAAFNGALKSSAFPNPFNPTTTISFGLSSRQDVTIEIYNMLGQKVSTLVDRSMPAGNHSVEWDASTYASGIYLYRVATDEFVDSKRLVLLK